MEDGGLLYQSARNRLIGRLREVEVDIDDLSELLKPLQEAQEAPTKDELRPLVRQLGILRKRKPGIRRPLTESDVLDVHVAGAVERLCDHMSDLRRVARPLTADTPPKNASLVAAAAANTAKALEQVRSDVLLLTVAYDTRELVGRLRVGRALDFTEKFKEKIPAEEDRKDIFKQLADNPQYFDDGVFDRANLKIWRRSPSKTARVLSYLAPIGFGILAGLLLVLVSVISFPKKLHLDDTGALLEAYALVLLGVIAHLAVENIKQSQAGVVPVIAIGEFLDRLHLRWAGLAPRTSTCWQPPDPPVQDRQYFRSPA